MTSPLQLAAELDPASVSWWFQDALACDGAAVEPLAADREADVAVVGGGYTGLWAAIELAERGSADVVLLEAERCGSQASGKNGGVVHGYWTGLAGLVSAFGVDAARAIAEAGSTAQDGLRAFCAPRADELWWTERGSLKVATTARQHASLDAAVAAARAIGRPEQAMALTADEVRRHVRSPRFGRGVRFQEVGTVHPARLARALRADAVARGVAVHERTPVIDLRDEAGRYALRTPGGTVRASRVVLATNAALSGLEPVRPHVTNFSSYAVMSEPAPDALAEHGWTGGEALLDGRMFLHYFRTTPDGRVLMGTGSGPIGFGASLGRQLTRDVAAIDRAVEGLRSLLPAFERVGIAAAWGGPIDVSADHLPFFGTVPGTRIAYAAGYSGHGVNACWLGGQALTSLTLGIEDRWTRSPFCTRKVASLPPEPVRYLGGRLVRAAILSCEEAEERGGRGTAPARAVAALPRLLGMRIGTR